MEVQRYLVRFQREGRVHYLYTDNYETAMLAACSIYEDVIHLQSCEIWTGNDLLWKDGHPERVSS